MTSAQKQILNDAMDPEKVQLYCATHMYFGPSKPGAPEVKPGQNCPKCWTILYFHDIASAPPGERQARLDELEDVLNKVVELDKKGKWDFKPYRHSQIENSN